MIWDTSNNEINKQYSFFSNNHNIREMLTVLMADKSATTVYIFTDDSKKVCAHKENPGRLKTKQKQTFVIN